MWPATREPEGLAVGTESSLLGGRKGLRAEVRLEGGRFSRAPSSALASPRSLCSLLPLTSTYITP